MSNIKQFNPILNTDEQEIMYQTEQEVQHSIRWSQSEIFNQIAFGIDCYYGKRPFATTEGFSSYVSRDVLDAVESMIVPLVEIFTANQQAVKLTAADDSTDATLMGLATAEVNKILLRQNDGYRILHDWLKDGLLAKNGIVKSYWNEEFVTEEHSFEDLDDNELEALLLDENIDEDSLKVERKEVSQTTNVFGEAVTETMVFSKGTVNRILDKSRVVVENVPPEEFIVAERTRDIKNPAFCAQRSSKTLAELREMFPDKGDMIDGMAGLDDAEFNQILLARHAVDSTYVNYNETDSADPEQRHVWLYECYVQSTLPDGENKLWQVWTDRYSMLGMVEVDETPFDYWTPIPQAHKFYGLSIADVMTDVQQVNTNMMRGVLDHNRLAIHPRMQAVKGKYDVRALLDNRAGTVVEMSELNSVAPMPVHSAPQSVMETMGIMDKVKTERTGQSKASQGLSEDLLKGNKSGVMVDSVLGQGEMRLRGIARNCAYMGFAPLIKRVYSLWRENDTTVRHDDVVGDWTPQDLPAIVDTQVAVALGRNAQVEEAQFKMRMLAYGKENNMLTPEKEHALMAEVLRLNGEMNVNQYLPTPAEMDEQRMKEKQEEMMMQKMMDEQPSPQAQLEMEVKQSEMRNREHELAIQEMNAQARIAELELTAAENERKAEEMRLKHKEAMLKLQIDAQNSQVEAMVAMNGAELNQEKFETDTVMKTADMMQTAQASADVGAGRTNEALDNQGTIPLM